MADEGATAGSGLEAEEARLARAAAAGDGDAFAQLYERYASRAYNLALRLSGSSEDAADAVQEAFVSVMRRLPELGERDLAFGSYLFTATRNATYDLMRRQQRSSPSDSIPEGAVPVGSGSGGLGLDPGDPDEDPDRRQLLAAQREEIRAANGRLPERQREALALRELEELSYDEIAAIMEMNRNSVAQLISRARINLRDELRGTAFSSIAASSPECERALPLIAMRDDGQLDPDSADAAWLAEHRGACETCRLATEAMQEAGASYRLWVPAAIAPWVFRETVARAAEAVGADWSELVRPRRRLTRRLAATTAAGIVLLGGAALFAAELDRSASPPRLADEETTVIRVSEATPVSTAKRRPRPSREEQVAGEALVPAPATSAPTPAASAPAPTGAPPPRDDEPPSPQPAGSVGAGVGTTGTTAEPKPDPPPAPAAEPEPAPPPAVAEPEPSAQPEPQPPPEEPPPSEEPPSSIPPGSGVPGGP